MFPVSSTEPGDRKFNDDYFPQGDEFEDEIGKEDSTSIQETLTRHYDEDDSDNVVATVLQFGDHQSQNLSTIQKQNPILEALYPNPLFIYLLKGVLSKEVDKETFEKLKTLVDKVMDFKKRVFQTRAEEKNTEKRTEDGKPDSSGQERLVPTI